MQNRVLLFTLRCPTQFQNWWPLQTWPKWPSWPGVRRTVRTAASRSTGPATASSAPNACCLATNQAVRRDGRRDSTVTSQRVVELAGRHGNYQATSTAKLSSGQRWRTKAGGLHFRTPVGGVNNDVYHHNNVRSQLLTADVLTRLMKNLQTFWPFQRIGNCHTVSHCLVCNSYTCLVLIIIKMLMQPRTSIKY